jgi:hypothetical protein
MKKINMYNGLKTHVFEDKAFDGFKHLAFTFNFDLKKITSIVKNIWTKMSTNNIYEFFWAIQTPL